MATKPVPARPTTTAAPTNGFTSAHPIPDINARLFYLIGHQKGTGVPTADEVLELVLKQQAQHAEEVTKAYSDGKAGE